MSKTILYAAETLIDNRIVHVMGYQNQAETWGPNAMLLPIPTDMKMGATNMLDMSKAKHVLSDYGEAVKRHTRGFSRGLRSLGMDDDLEAPVVFDKGSYTVVLAEDARAIPGALDRVPANKRPAPKQAIFDAYAALYPNWKIALCCWDGRLSAEPLLWWYEPTDPGRLFLPALDGHDGNPPNIHAKVNVDHSIVVGSVTKPQGNNVHFKDTITDELRPFLATKVTGTEFQDMRMSNGDFAINMSRVAYGAGGDIQRVLPPGAR